MKHFGLPTSEQWRKIGTAGIFSFLSGFLAALTAQGGIQLGLGWEGLLSMLAGAMVSGFNVALYTIYTTFFKEGE